LQFIEFAMLKMDCSL